MAKRPKAALQRHFSPASSHLVVEPLEARVELRALVCPVVDDGRLDHPLVPDYPVGEELLHHIYVDQLFLEKHGDALEEDVQLVDLEEHLRVETLVLMQPHVFSKLLGAVVTLGAYLLPYLPIVLGEFFSTETVKELHEEPGLACLKCLFLGP